MVGRPGGAGPKTRETQNATANEFFSPSSSPPFLRLRPPSHTPPLPHRRTPTPHTEPVDHATRELLATQRPSLTGLELKEEIQAVMAEREPLYLSCSQIILPPGELEDLAAKLAQALEML